jgi:hypothetical protein
MIFERQRVLVSLLDALGGSVAPMDFQKLLLLYMHEGEGTPAYEFVPYKFGGFSFTSYADRRKLVAEGILVNDDQRWALTATGRQLAHERSSARIRARAFSRRYAHLRGDALVQEQYRRYP